MKSENVTTAVQSAAQAAENFNNAGAPGEAADASSTTKMRKNFFFVIVTFTDGTTDVSHGLRGSQEINDWLRGRDASQIKDTRVIFGHERAARRQTRLVFS